MSEFRHQEIFEHSHDTTVYRKLTSDYVSTTTFEGQEIVKVAPEALSLLAREAMDDVAHLLRPGHLQQLAKILDDPEYRKAYEADNLVPLYMAHDQYRPFIAQFADQTAAFLKSTRVIQ